MNVPPNHDLATNGLFNGLDLAVAVRHCFQGVSEHSCVPRGKHLSVFEHPHVNQLEEGFDICCRDFFEVVAIENLLVAYRSLAGEVDDVE